MSEQDSDLERLKEIFFEITDCKDDSQQRGWAVHDDEKAISDLLDELLQILVRGEGKREREREREREKRGREGGREGGRGRESGKGVELTLRIHMYGCLYVCVLMSLYICLQCDANPEVSKAAVMEDKYENVLTLITYYGLVSFK